MKKKVVVGLSGGVDSSVAAYLLKEQGYEVIGATMQIWQEESIEHGKEKDVRGSSDTVADARNVAEWLGIPYYVMNFRNEFKKNVVDYFVREYQVGRTPNPCVMCNRFVKWEALLQRSFGIGADYIATGHYAAIVQLENGRYALRKSKTTRKDQTYALYNLTQEQLAHTLFPLGMYEKEQVREIAKKAGIRVADKPDSQEICFVPDHDYAGFIQRETKEAEQAGLFVTQNGEVLGVHQGISHYTIGQRKGLNLAMGRPVFVTEIRPSTREVVIGSNEDLMVTELIAGQLNYMAVDTFQKGQQMVAKIRYSHQGESCRVMEFSKERQQIKIQFANPVRAVTPGQAVVFYQDGLVLGGGTIC